MRRLISVLGLMMLFLSACGGKKAETDASSPLDGIPTGQNAQSAVVHDARQCPNLRGNFRLRNGVRRSSLLFTQDFRGELMLVSDNQQQLPINGRPHSFDRNRTVITAACADGKISFRTRVENGPDRYVVISPRMVGVIGLTITDYSQNPPSILEYDRGF